MLMLGWVGWAVCVSARLALTTHVDSPGPWASRASGKIPVYSAGSRLNGGKMENEVAGAAGGGGPYFPSFHPRMHTAHNNDVNGPFFYNGVYHIFMQQVRKHLKKSVEVWGNVEVQITTSTLTCQHNEMECFATQ